MCASDTTGRLDEQAAGWGRDVRILYHRWRSYLYAEKGFLQIVALLAPFSFSFSHLFFFFFNPSNTHTHNLSLEHTHTFRILPSNVVELFPLFSFSPHHPPHSFFLITMMETTSMDNTTTTTFYCYVSVFSTDHIAQISLGKLSHPTELRRQVLVRNTLMTCLSSERAQEESWLDACFDELSCDDEFDDQDNTPKNPPSAQPPPPPPPQPINNHSQQLVLALPIYRHHHHLSNAKQPAL